MNEGTLTVAQVLTKAQDAVVERFPTPIWVRGEVTGYRRTSGGAAFFRLADPETDEASLDVAGRGRVMAEVDRSLAESGLGGLRDGVEVRVKGTIGVERRGSVIRLGLLEIDPAFTAGRIAIDRAELLRRMTVDGSRRANRSIAMPLVPLRVGLVTSRGSAAHADFMGQLRRSGFRFAVKTAHTTVQGESAPARIATAIARLGREDVDVIALIRGGGAQLDLAAFDTEVVARAVATANVPVVTGLGHDIDRTVADEAAAHSEKTPSAAGEWLVARVADFANRVGTARHLITRESLGALERQRHLLQRTAADMAGGLSVLQRHSDTLDRLRDEVATTSRRVLVDQRRALDSLLEWFSAVGVERTLSRGFALVTGPHGVVKSAGEVAIGDTLTIRFSDGSVKVVVRET